MADIIELNKDNKKAYVVVKFEVRISFENILRHSLGDDYNDLDEIDTAEIKGSLNEGLPEDITEKVIDDFDPEVLDVLPEWIRKDLVVTINSITVE